MYLKSNMSASTQRSQHLSFFLFHSGNFPLQLVFRRSVTEAQRSRSLCCHVAALSRETMDARYFMNSTLDPVHKTPVPVHCSESCSPSTSSNPSMSGRRSKMVSRWQEENIYFPCSERKPIENLACSLRLQCFFLVAGRKKKLFK